MERLPLKFSGQFYQFPAKQLDNQNCINWYMTVDEEGKFRDPLLPFPGSLLFSNDTNSHIVRYLFSLNNILYGVVDNQFRIYADTGSYVVKGTLVGATGQARIIANDTQLLITEEGHGYVYQLVANQTRSAGDFYEITAATSFISDPTFTGAGINDLYTSGNYTGSGAKTYKVEIDGVGSGSAPDTFRWSDSNGSTWNATGVTITGGYQNLNHGVIVNFIHTGGHTLNDYWTFDTTSDSAFYAPLIPSYMDTYGIYPKPNSQRFYITSSEDFSLINALDYAQTNQWPDNTVAALSINQEVFFFGNSTIEVWYDTGAAVFPFQKRPNLLINYGCSAPYSVAFGGNNIMFWLGGNRTGGPFVLMMSGYMPQIISSEPLNEAFKTYSKVDDAEGFVVEWNGHLFYFITFPSQDITWVYDVTTNRWQQRSTRRRAEFISPNEYIDGRYVANCCVFHNGKNLIGDYKSGNIYEWSSTTYKDGTASIICEATTAPMHVNLDRVMIYSLQLDFESATANSDSDDPQVMLQFSKDGGYSWSKELWRPLGKTGEYNRRVKWNIVGTSRAWVFRIRISDPVYRVLLGGVIEVEDLGS